MATTGEVLNAAVKFHQAGNLAEAERLYRDILDANPRHADAWHLLGLVTYQRGDLATALGHITRAIQLDPAQASYPNHLGEVYRAMRSWPQAEACCRRAVELKPDFAIAHNTLGALLADRGQLNEAVECYQRALEFRPNFAEALNNLGNVFQLQGRNAEAMVCFEQTLRIEPNHSQAHYNRSRMLLAGGDFAAGWEEHEWRLNCSDLEKRAFVEPRWQGEPLEGRTLLVHAEQGLGDAIQFCRYVPLVARFGGKVIVEVPSSLFPLFEQSAIPGLVAKGTPPGPFDLQVPMMSLPLICGTTLQTIPSRVPYLSADPQWVEYWRNALGAEPGLRVGISWQGRTTYLQDRFRSIPLAQFEPLAQEGIELISLQKGSGSDQLAALAGRFRVRELEGLDEQHGPFSDTAAIMKNLDLVIASDSAIAHLAGALGVHTWVALPLSPDWRWLRDREDSPWYPTMRLFRQTSFDDWQSVLGRMAEVLRRKVAASR